MFAVSATVLVIIVTWNKKNYVLNLLNSLSSLDYPKDNLSFVVVDNASEDGTVNALKEQFPDVTLLCNSENLGGTGGFNTGLQWAYEQQDGKFDFLWLLDNDVVVHKHALKTLLSTLEQNPDAAVAGSTMMQLDYPWQINEMGAFVDRGNGSLVLNRHFEPIPNWRGKSIDELLNLDIDLTQLLIHCRPWIDVDYVAAASLLIRAPIAKQAGLWMDFFIHFDDVEWCLRIQSMGYRILASANSLIWHLSAAAKVPSWVLYYDNRNILYLLEKHSSAEAVKNTQGWIAKKALYYALLGKLDLARLHLDALQDFQGRVQGKKSITLTGLTKSTAAIGEILEDRSIKSVLLSFAVNLQATKIQSELVHAMRSRPDLEVYYLTPPKRLPGFPKLQLPKVIPIHIADSIFLRYWHYFKLCGRFDLVVQSDYQPLLPLTWISQRNIFINDENFCLRTRPNWKQLKEMLAAIWRARKAI